MKKVTLHDKTFRLSIPHRIVVRRVRALAAELNRHYKGHGDGPPPVFVSVLNGAFMFTAELLRHIDFPCETAFVRLSSYRGTASSGGVERILGLEGYVLAGRQVIVLEDVVETGRTVEAIHRLLAEKQPESVAFATLFFKPEAYSAAFKIDHYAMRLPNDFIIGYGLDYNQLGRNLPDVYTLVSE